MTFAATIVVLAAGKGTRMGAAAGKLALEVAGQPLLAWTFALATRALPAGASARWLLVTSPQVPPLPAPDDVQVVVAQQAHRGMAFSLDAGLRAAASHDAGAFVLLGDDPIAALALGDVWAAAAREPQRPACVDRDVPHPVYLPAHVLTTLPQPSGDHGLRDLLRSRADLRRVPTSAPAPVDADTPADLDHLAARLQCLG